MERQHLLHHGPFLESLTSSSVMKGLMPTKTKVAMAVSIVVAAAAIAGFAFAVRPKPVPAVADSLPTSWGCLKFCSGPEGSQIPDCMRRCNGKGEG